MSEPVIEAYVTNLGKYNEGELCGEYLKLPATKEDVQALLQRIGVDGVLYEEFFITDYETNLAGMQNLGEYESIDELNYLASQLSDMEEWELEKFEAAAVYGVHTGSVKDLINLTQNLDYYDYIPGVEDEDDLGRHYIEELGTLEVPEYLSNYIDYEAYGRDVSLDEGGIFTSGGYVVDNRDSFIEHYSGRDDIPEEYRIFAYPDPPDKMPMREQLEMFGKMASSKTAADKPASVRDER